MWAVIVVVVVAVIIIITIITTTIIIIYKVTVLLNRKRLSFWWDFALARRFKSTVAVLRRIGAAALGSENKWPTSRVESWRTDGRTDGPMSADLCWRKIAEYRIACSWGITRSEAM